MRENLVLIFPSDAKRIHHSFPDPAKFTGSTSEMEKRFDEVRDEIKAYCLQFVHSEI
jgi:arsenate reductase (thioredoxin)